MKIEDTAWAKRFKAECPTAYDDAIKIAGETSHVTLEKRDDHSAKGDFVWAITSVTEPDFWLDGCKTKKEALAVCKELKWVVRK